MKKSLFVFLFASISVSSFVLADDGSGFYVGGGIAATSVNEDGCNDCTTSGYAVEGGYSFNRVIDVDVKLSSTEGDDFNYDLDMQYLGVNLGTDFGTNIFRLYGKVGVARTEVSIPGYGKENDSDVAYGFGLRWVIGERRGIYIKLEGIGTEFQGDSVGAALLAVGYQF